MKSGADFPAYIQEIKQLGVIFYETYVSDGHTSYFDTANIAQSTAGKYKELAISETVDLEQFKVDLKSHQQGKY